MVHYLCERPRGAAAGAARGARGARRRTRGRCSSDRARAEFDPGARAVRAWRRPRWARGDRPAYAASGAARSVQTTEHDPVGGTVGADLLDSDNRSVSHSLTPNPVRLAPTAARRWIGLRITCAHGSVVGRVEDAMAGHGPVRSWLVVRVGRVGGARTLVPAADCAAAGGRVWSPFDRVTILGAPRVGPRASIACMEPKLVAHYEAARKPGAHVTSSRSRPEVPRAWTESAAVSGRFVAARSGR
jgi:hypothetical protein